MCILTDGMTNLVTSHPNPTDGGTFYTIERRHRAVLIHICIVLLFLGIRIPPTFSRELPVMGPDSIIVHRTIFIGAIGLGSVARMDEGYHIYFPIIIPVEFGKVDELEFVSHSIHGTVQEIHVLGCRKTANPGCVVGFGLREIHPPKDLGLES